MNLKKNYLYILFFPLFLNFFYNFLTTSPVEKLLNFNYYDLLSSLLLFLFLFLIGELIKNSLQLVNKSISIVLYLLSFFIADNIFTILSFGTNHFIVFLIVNLFWLIFLLSKKTKILDLTFLILSITLLNLYNHVFFNNLSKNKNVIGDVKDVHLQNVQNLYEKGYLYSMNNSTLEGYPQLVAYFQATLNRLSISIETFSNLSSAVNVLFFLTLLLVYEAKISNFGKFIMGMTFTVLIYNSEWLKLIFVDSLMTEGTLSYLLAVILMGVVQTKNKGSKNLRLVFLLLGTLYLAKQFISLLSLIAVIYFLFLKETKKFAVFGFFGLILKELSFVTVFKNLTKNYHLKQIDLIDTFFDLILFRDLKISNVQTILRNLFFDKPSFLIFVIFFILLGILILNKKAFNQDLVLYSSIVLINFLLVFLLYVSVWRNMELESPIRYFLNLLHLTIVYEFLMIEEIKNK